MIRSKKENRVFAKKDSEFDNIKDSKEFKELIRKLKIK